MSKPFPSDLEIAQAATLQPITEIAEASGINEDRLEPYGKYVAKVQLTDDTTAEKALARGSKYIVVTAVTPTPLGEGKTATSVSLAQGMAATGRKAMLTLRQPSMGPTFGIKGGAAGGGRDGRHGRCQLQTRPTSVQVKKAELTELMISSCLAKPSYI